MLDKFHCVSCFCFKYYLHTLLLCKLADYYSVFALHSFAAVTEFYTLLDFLSDINRYCVVMVGVSSGFVRQY